MRIRCRWAVALLVAGAAAAASAAQVGQGTNELNASGAVTVTGSGGDSTTTTVVGVGLGHFVSNTLELGGDFSLLKGGGGDAFGAANLRLSLHFPKTDSTALPYVGVTVWRSYGLSDNEYMYGVYGGVKLFVSDGAALSVQPFITRATADFGNATSLGIVSGVSLFF
ncbi:outer membrane beta-barrel protein [Candidatus Poribacteria bacterium]|nr:outer membrane beta-barrel protein [Candidatus Poribacteria bacterium]